jgi:hypothetical protein
MWVGIERKLDLMEEASDQKQSNVAAKDTREEEREIGTKWNYHYLELEQLTLDAYKLGIYTPKLMHKPFRHITNMARPLMDIVNTTIRYPYSTLPCTRRVPKTP